TEAPAVGRPGVAVGLVHHGSLGPGHDRADIHCGTLIDESIDGEAEEVLCAFGLENAGNGRGTFHGLRSGRKSRQLSDSYDTGNEGAIVEAAGHRIATES